MGLLKFQVETLVEWKIWFLIQGELMFHTSMDPAIQKCEIHEKHDCSHDFHVFLIFHVVGFIKSMQHRYSLDDELNFSSNKNSRLKFE